MGEITRQLMSNNFEPVFSFQRDPVQNRMLMGDRIRELREQKNTDITTLAFYRISGKSSIQRTFHLFCFFQKHLIGMLQINSRGMHSRENVNLQNW